MGHVLYGFHIKLYQMNTHHLLAYPERHSQAQIAAVPVHDIIILNETDEIQTFNIIFATFIGTINAERPY